MNTYHYVLYLHLLSLFVGIGAGAVILACLLQLRAARTVEQAAREPRASRAPRAGRSDGHVLERRWPAAAVGEIVLGTNTKALVDFARIQLHVELTYSR